MPRLSRCAFVTLMFAGGCAVTPAGGENGGSGGTAQASGGKGGGTANTGGSTVGAGGSRGGSGGGSAAGSGGTTAVACTPGDPTNLVSSSTWICDATTPVQIQGSFYSYGDGSSCTTPSPLTCSATAGCCMSGTTVVDTTYAKWGCGLGMELNSSGGTAPVKSVYSGPVKCFDITLTGSSGGNEVRIGFTQSKDTTNKVSPYTAVAPFATGWSGRVCFASANCPAWATAAQCTKVADAPGTPYDLQIQVSAGSTASAVGPFNVCVTKIAPVIDQGSAGTTNSCSSLSGQGTLVGGFDSQHVKCNGQDYIVQNNVWGSSASQTLTYGPGTTFKVTAQNGTGDTSGAPASYPSIFIGSNGNRSTTGNGLPKAVSALGTVQTSWTWADSGVSGTYNATYDVWFSTSSAGDPATATIPSAVYLMVWLYKPTGAQPNGSMTSSATIAGNNWNLWVGTSNGKPCYSYVALNKLSSVSFDLNLFIKDAVSRGYVQNAWGLIDVFSGFEIWSGGVGLQTTDFAVTVN